MKKRLFVQIFYWLPITGLVWWAFEKKLVLMTTTNPTAAQHFIRFILGFFVWLIIDNFLTKREHDKSE